MVGETKGWVSAADNIFASFGDVIKNAAIIGLSDGAYDENAGGFAQTEVSTSTLVVPTKKSKEFIAKHDNFAVQFNAYLVRGSDFITPPLAGSILRINSVDHKIEEVEPDSAQTGAFYRIFVKKK